MSKKSDNIRKIENYLQKYTTYKTGILNCKRQLNYLYPNMTASYSFDKTGVSYIFSSSTEKSAIDRIESKRALDLLEQIAHAEIIIDSIDEALMTLEERERKFIEYRYFCRLNFYEISKEMNSSERSVFKIRNAAIDKLCISLSNLLIF